LSPAGAHLPAYVIPADEERVIAQDTLDWLMSSGSR
jgi:hypothetical protein